MDDPWGSPWASTDTPSDNDLQPSSRTNIFLSPPPKVFFGSATGLPTQSPWSGSNNDDDDSAGVWAAADRTDVTDNQNEWATWGEPGVQPPRLSPRINRSGKESPLAWPENAAPSPVFIADSRSRTSSIVRHPSPDPWATESSFTKRLDNGLPGPLEPKSHDTLAISNKPFEEPLPAHDTVAGHELVEDRNDARPLVEKEPPSEGARATGENGRPSMSRDVNHDDANSRAGKNPAVDDLQSRPSSTFTVDSHDQPERQDSPITSIDEDRGGRMQNTLRKTSGKVQELVGIFDGLARSVSEELPTLSHRDTSRATSRDDKSRKPNPTGGKDDDDDDRVGFGEFGDATTKDDEFTQSPSEASSEFSSTPKAELNDVFATKPRLEGQESCIDITVTAPAQPQTTTNKLLDISFDTNLGSLDKLFPGLPRSPASNPADNWEMPENVITDSFTTISERKSWYRISRYGSMRKHNSGDDENYHRVTWPTSQLHSDTIKIVRRWMEEDSYAGKSALGGTKRTGFFDWDSNAPAVELDEVFRRRKSLTKHKRVASIPVANTTVQNVVADKHQYRNSTGISLPKELQLANHPVISGPSFGWHSNQAKEFTPTAGFLHHNSQKINSVLPPAPLVQTATHHPSPTKATPVEQDDDDDWGEMVSSPSATKQYNELSVSEPPLSNSRTQNHGPTPQPPLDTPNIDQSAEQKVQLSQDKQVASSELWLFPGKSALSKPHEVHELPLEYASEIEKTFTVFEASTPLSSRNPPKTSSQKPIIGSQTSGDNNMTSRATVRNGSPGIMPLKDSANFPVIDDQEELIVERILQNLPDLSYMLR
ncbi:hypothetical protein F4802DRAFT_320489 [Xylaria palmicola]|nr:hypothetical protein F4802DRAFT_320489 [Xylaria palmicola]